MALQPLTQPLRRTLAMTLVSLTVGCFAANSTLAQSAAQVAAEGAAHPMYKPSSRSPEAVDILSNAYGGSRSAPNALQLSDTVADFVLAKAGGGQVSLKTLRATGPVALIFYRGHW